MSASRALHGRDCTLPLCCQGKGATSRSGAEPSTASAQAGSETLKAWVKLQFKHSGVRFVDNGAHEFLTARRYRQPCLLCSAPVRAPGYLVPAAAGSRLQAHALTRGSPLCCTPRVQLSGEQEYVQKLSQGEGAHPSSQASRALGSPPKPCRSCRCMPSVLSRR